MASTIDVREVLSQRHFGPPQWSADLDADGLPEHDLREAVSLGRLAAMIGVLIVGMLAGVVMATTVSDTVPAYELRASQYLPGGARLELAPASAVVPLQQGACRAYSEEVMIGGKMETIYATACRQLDVNQVDGVSGYTA